MIKRRIILRIEPEKGSWMVSAQLPGQWLGRRVYIGQDGHLTQRRSEVRIYGTAERAYHAVEQLSAQLERKYPTVAQEWDVSRCATEILTIQLL